LSRKHGWEDPRESERPPLWESFKAALPALFAPIIILGGLRSGLFTPTEAAVVAVTYGVIVGSLIYRNLGIKDLFNLATEAAVTSGVVMFIIALAGIFAWAGTTLGTFQHLADGLLSLSDSGWVLLILVMVLVLIAGMLLDAVSIYLILIPIVLPLMNHFGWNPVWFGILLAMNIAIGQFTPPVAVNLMVTTRIANIRLEHTIGWALIFIAAMASSLILVMLVPGIALWLPDKLGYVVGNW
ncbi:MAG: TRAP transporter large permease subunit, partial [Oceanospirillales bacterium]|nr:TRAP transporter large permease subunit [Oceanospirillales bacterium]